MYGRTSCRPGDRKFAACFPAGKRLSAVDERLDEAALSETERFVLQAIARAEAKQSRQVDSYRDGFGFIDG